MNSHWMFLLLGTLVCLTLGMAFSCGDDDDGNDDDENDDDEDCSTFCDLLADCGLGQELNIGSMNECMAYCDELTGYDVKCVIDATSCDGAKFCLMGGEEGSVTACDSDTVCDKFVQCGWGTTEKCHTNGFDRLYSECSNRTKFWECGCICLESYGDDCNSYYVCLDICDYRHCSE